MRIKLLFIVIDGAADSLNDKVTSLEKAYTPGLDELTSRSVCGAMYTVAKGVAPESDEAVISILGYDTTRVHPGRGVIEALGAGMDIKENEVYFRANFATIDPDTRRIIDRRVGRSLSTFEARKLAEALDGIELGIYGGYVRVKATVGHRAVVAIGSRTHRLSPMVSNNDPSYVRRGLTSVAAEKYEPFVQRIVPLENTPEARVTADLANVFVDKAIGILRNHGVNLDRVSKGKPPANVLLLRDAGSNLPRVESIADKYGCKPCLIAEMPVEVGIGRMLGANVIQLEPPFGDPSVVYGERLNKTIEALGKHDFVYIHLKGPDEPGHDGDFEEKVKRIEEIDRFFIQPLLNYELKDTAIVVTADHATPPSRRSHTDDPVPIAAWIPGVKPDGVKRFTERECMRGSLGLFEKGYEFLPFIINRYLK